MEANEAPEKIYLQENTTTDCYGEFWPEWFEARAKDSDIEYIRTDAFIEKAEEYLMEYEFNDSPTIADRRKRVDEFIKYMKGE